jgi:tRNA nucleotidyltransferase (CCA-adding enzyme)
MFLLPLRGARSLHQLLTMSKGKLVSPHFTAILTPGLLRLENTFKSAGYDFRLVGGVVRDLLLGQPPKDIDIATECTPQVMLKLLSRDRFKAILTGLEHGTVTVVNGDETYEVGVVIW